MQNRTRKTAILTRVSRSWWTRAVAASGALLLCGAGVKALSADVPAAVGNTAPAEIPEPSSDVPAPKKAKKLKSSPAAAPAASKPKTQVASAPAPAKDQPAPAASAQAAAPKAAEKAPSASAPPVAAIQPKPAPTNTVDTAATPQPASATAITKDQEQTDTDSLVPFVRNARDKWLVSVSFDDYWFNAPISEGGHGTQTGNLYGETLSIGPPVWHGDTAFEVSYRQGLLYGAVGYPNALYSSMETFVQEASIGFRFRSLPWMHDGKERGHVIGYVGASWDGWDSTETLINRRKWPATAKPSLTTDWNMFMANLGLGYDLTLWNPTTKWMSYRLGVRAEAIGALGGSSWDQKGNNSSDTLAVYGLARGTLYMDLMLYNTIGIFVEGGYQESWWRFWEDPPAGLGVNEFEGYWGAFGRAGLAVQF